MKYMGIDFGSKRIGIALSDDDGTLARPVAVCANDGNIIDTLEDIIHKEGVGSIVVGRSDGNTIQQAIDEFIAQLSLVTMLPVDTITEAFSSVEAHGREGKESLHARSVKKTKTDAVDAKAAAVILQRYLDAH